MRDWPSLAMSPDGRYLVIEVFKSWTRSDVYLLDRRGSATSPAQAQPLSPKIEKRISRLWGQQQRLLYP